MMSNYLGQLQAHLQSDIALISRPKKAAIIPIEASVSPIQVCSALAACQITTFRTPSSHPTVSDRQHHNWLDRRPHERTEAAQICPQLQH